MGFIGIIDGRGSDSGSEEESENHELQSVPGASDGIYGSARGLHSKGKNRIPQKLVGCNDSKGKIKIWTDDFQSRWRVFPKTNLNCKNVNKYYKNEIEVLKINLDT